MMPCGADNYVAYYVENPRRSKLPGPSPDGKSLKNISRTTSRRRSQREHNTIIQRSASNIHTKGTNWRINLIPISFPLINFNLLLNFLSFFLHLGSFPWLGVVRNGRLKRARGVQRTDIFHIAFVSYPSCFLPPPLAEPTSRPLKSLMRRI